MALRAKTKVKTDDIPRPAIVGWYWYFPTAEELRELTVEVSQVCKVHWTAGEEGKGMFVAEFIREVRQVSKLMGTWSARLEAKHG